MVRERHCGRWLRPPRICVAFIAGVLETRRRALLSAAPYRVISCSIRKTLNLGAADKRMLDKGDIKPVVIPADAMKLFGKSGAERGTGP